VSRVGGDLKNWISEELKNQQVKDDTDEYCGILNQWTFRIVGK
jgi:hypothetical protein